MDKEIIDIEVKGNVVRFYLGKNGKQWGDDWNDAPYEHNAGRVYDEFIKSVHDVHFPFGALVLEPFEGTTNSIWTKEDMVKGNVPCLIVVPEDVIKGEWRTNFDYWVGNDSVKRYYFGDLLEASPHDGKEQHE